MDFNAKDLNNFTALSSESANKTSDAKNPAAPKVVAVAQISSDPKSFFEQIYDKN